MQILSSDPEVMSYIAHSKRARIDSYDTNENNHSSGALINHKDRLVLHINELYLSADYSDIHFVFGPDIVPAHKSIICVNNKWRELVHEKESVDMEDTGLTPFKELLRYLYTGRLNIDDYEPQMLTEIRQLAERFELWDLVQPLQEQEDIDISLDNVLSLFAETPVSSATAKACLSFIAHNTQDVLYLDDFYDLPDDHIYEVLTRDDLNATEQIVFEAVKRYVSGSASGDKDKKSLLGTVRFELLPFEYIWTNVRKFCDEKKLFTIEELSAISAAKAKLTAQSSEIRSRAHCLPGVDVIAIRAKHSLSTRVLRGKIGDIGDEANTLELDLGLHYLVNGLGLLISSSTKTRYAFKVEISVDNKNWNLLYDFTKHHTSNKLDLAFDPRVVRFIRLSEGVSYPDWADKRKETKPFRKIQNLVAVYEEPTGLVRLRDNLLASKYLFSHMTCDFTYKSWFKKNGKNFYVCALNDPIVCILSQPVWMDTINLYIPEEEDKEFNFTVEVTSNTEVNFKGKDKGWLLVGNYRDESRKGEVEVCFEPTIVNVFRVTGTKILNPKGKEKDFAVEIRI